MIKPECRDPCTLALCFNSCIFLSPCVKSHWNRYSNGLLSNKFGNIMGSVTHVGQKEGIKWSSSDLLEKLCTYFYLLECSVVNYNIFSTNYQVTQPTRIPDCFLKVKYVSEHGIIFEVKRFAWFLCSSNWLGPNITNNTEDRTRTSKSTGCTYYTGKGIYCEGSSFSALWN